MSKPVTYSVLIRNGQKRCFEDLSAPLYRELLWGPDAYEEWLNQGSEIDGEPEELSGVAIVDFDTKQLRWGEDGDIHEPPRAQAVHQRLLEQAWPGFTITFLPIDELYVEVHGPAERDEDDSEYVDRPNTVRDATLCLDEDDDIEEDYDDEEIDYPKAWLTIIDKDGKAKQRVLIEVSVDLIIGRESAIKRLLKLDAVAIPPEIAVKEGLWIETNVARDLIEFCGPAVFRRLPNWNPIFPTDHHCTICCEGQHRPMSSYFICSAIKNAISMACS